ncbi:hypothetical protein UFOVP580_41 [uncultured Caudovirales phage]|uniref:Uncharacterized protein n=1 Tax=uncultured Caudovirales phage TaxID=2100421 RepID=A0A6J5PHX9_9CAUD|nr:hypothetical protein UFOVP580_41 [uncultured Caudovirales phage]
MKTPTTPYEALLMASAVKILHSDPRKDEGYMNALVTGVDITKQVWSNQGFDSQPVPTEDIFLGVSNMAKADKSRGILASAAAAISGALTGKAEDTGTPQANSTSVDEDGNTVTHNPLPVKEKSPQELKTEAAQAKIAEKAAKKAAADAKKAERLARIEALKAEGKNYTGSMLSLADRVKQGVYVKGTTGQLRSNDELAQALDAVTPTGVIQLAKHVLNLESNPYSHLNVGQQSMNLRNKMRGAITKKVLTIEAVKAAIVELDLDVSKEIAARVQAKADAKAKREADAAAKKAAAEAATAAKKAEPAEATA